MDYNDVIEAMKCSLHPVGVQLRDTEVGFTEATSSNLPKLS